MEHKLIDLRDKDKEHRITDNYSDFYDRRSGPSLDVVLEHIKSLDAKVSGHIEAEEKLKPKMLELIVLLEQSKGAVTFIKYLVLVIATLAGVYTWVTTHFHFKV